MNRKEYGWIVMLSVVAGLAGGMVSNRFFSGEPAWAQRTTQHEKTITAEKILIVDADGRTRAKLGLWPSGKPGLFVYDKDGIPHTSLNLSADHPRLSLIDNTGKVIWSVP